MARLLMQVHGMQPDAWRACTSTSTGRYAGAVLDVAGTLTHAELAATLRAGALA